MADMTMIQIDILSKTYPQDHVQTNLCVLQDVHFNIKSGEFCCIVGPSGSGKTTLLNLISGLDKNLKGSILINGEAPTEGAVPGYMFQSSRLMPWLTVRENVTLVLQKGASEERVDDLLNEIGLNDFADVYPKHLSGGMRRRVALARAIITEPPLLLLDEPFLSLDASIANHLRRQLIDICERRSTTVVFVTHDLREALYLADRVLFLSSRPGKIVLDHFVEIQRPRVPEGEAVEMLKLNLLKNHPKLLSGLVEINAIDMEAIGE